MIRKKLLLVLFLVAFNVSITTAETYQTSHFIIQTEMDPRYVNFIRLNLEAFYDGLNGNYFDKGWNEPLLIYYSQKQTDSQQLLIEHSRQGKFKYDHDRIGYGKYINEIPAVYTHRLMDNGSLSGWGTLFHEVSHHFVALNYDNSPAWFNEGLVCLLAEQTRVVKGKLLIGKPNPWREYELRKVIEKGKRINLRHLTTLSTKEFYSSGGENYHLVRALFYWLYETGNLKPYLRGVQLKGYSVSVLEETLNKSSAAINNELLAFIKKNCYAGAFLEQSRLVKNTSDKIPLLSKALELKPDYCAAWLELARCNMAGGDYSACRENLKHILDAPVSAEYTEAFFLMGNSFYNAKDFSQALIHYQQALDYAEYNEDMYEIYHWMGNCYHFLKDNKAASQMHAKFLELNWEPQQFAKLADYSKKYVEMSEKQLK